MYLVVSRLVTAYSKIDIEILCKFPLKGDVVVGKVSLDVNELLHANNGQRKYRKTSHEFPRGTK